MENSEQNTLISELTQGLELVKQLKYQLTQTSSPETRQMLLQKIISSYEKALLIMTWRGLAEQRIQPVESPISINETDLNESSGRPLKENQQDNGDASKKRKTMHRWTEQVKACPENGLEGPPDDGYSWRKYGQKDILGAIYPRSYYRCTYRNIRACSAVKQVQRSDEDPFMFDITYIGTHTCNQTTPSVSAPTSPMTQEVKLNSGCCYHHQNHSNEILLNFQTNLRVNTENLHGDDMATSFSFPSTSLGFGSNSFLDSFPPFTSPAVSETNYFSRLQRIDGDQHGHSSESNLTGLVSAATSATNSPILDLNLEFSGGIDPNFPFDTLGLFS